MAISTDAAIHFFGTADDLDSTAASVADGAISVVGDLAAWTNDDDASSASVVFEGAFTTGPDVGSFIQLVARLMDIEGTNEATAPLADYQHTWLGAFPLDNVGSSTTQRIPIDIDLPNHHTSQIYNFYIVNNSGQSLDSGWTLHITPRTTGPHA